MIRNHGGLIQLVNRKLTKGRGCFRPREFIINIQIYKGTLNKQMSQYLK